MSLEYITLLFLFVVFVMAEVYRIKRGSRGVIISVNDYGLPSIVLPAIQLQVRLADGQHVTATASCCVACLGRLKIGDEVRVCRLKDGYTADLLWFKGREGTLQKASCDSLCKWAKTTGKPYGAI
jgi:hypothetical protein